MVFSESTTSSFRYRYQKCTQYLKCGFIIFICRMTVFALFLMSFLKLPSIWLMVLGKGQQLLDCNHQFHVKRNVIRVSVIFFPMFVYSEAWLPHFCSVCSALRSFWSSANVWLPKRAQGLLKETWKTGTFTVCSLLQLITPGIDPQRTPVAESFLSLSPSICFLSFKQLSVYKTSFPLILWQLNFFNSLQCGTMSEALWKFKYIMSSESPLSAWSLTLL